MVRTKHTIYQKRSLHAAYTLLNRISRVDANASAYAREPRAHTHGVAAHYRRLYTMLCFTACVASIIVLPHLVNTAAIKVHVGAGLQNLPRHLAFGRLGGARPVQCGAFWNCKLKPRFRYQMSRFFCYSRYDAVKTCHLKKKRWNRPCTGGGWRRNESKLLANRIATTLTPSCAPLHTEQSVHSKKQMPHCFNVCFKLHRNVGLFGQIDATSLQHQP